MPRPDATRDDLGRGRGATDRTGYGTRNDPVPDGAEPSRTGSSGAEPSRAQPIRIEPARGERGRRGATRTEPVRGGRTRTERGRTDAVSPAPTEAEPVRAEPVRGERGRRDPVRAEPTRNGSGRGERTRTEPTRTEPGRTGSGRSESGRPRTPPDRRNRGLAGVGGLPTFAPDIALRSIEGHLTRTGTQVMAWYRLAAQPWSFRSDGQREVLIRQIAAQLGELQGRWLHVRVTHRPYPVHLWAEAFDQNALGRPPDVRGALGWDEFLEGEQRHLMGLSMSDKEVFVGVEVSGRSMLDRWVERAAPLLGRLAPAAVRAELAALSSEVAHIDAIMAGAGLDAVPAGTHDIAWLLRRSCALGLPAPQTLSMAGGSQRWETEDLAAFTQGVSLHQEPYAPTVKVVGRARGQHTTRNVAVLTVGLMEGMRIPEIDDPWMQHSDRLPFPAEWSARIYVRRPEEVTGELQRQMGKVRSQIRHYTHDHDLDPPMSLARQAERVLEVEDELTSGLTQLNTRLYGWWRIAVSGRDEAEALSRAQQVLELYRPKVQIEHPEAQYRFAREFIPGEPLASTAYRRRGSVMWAAAAVPAATASVGDRRGIMLGETCTATRRPVAWDPWLAQEVRRSSGLTAVVGGLGSGKSFLTGLIVYKTLRAGARWTVLDPSGPLAELTRLPELAPFSRHINLLRADPGILNPYRVVAEPRPEHFVDEDDPERAWRRERALAAATRRRLVLDVLTGLLPFDVARQPQTRIVLLRAVREVGGAADRHPGLVIDTLRRHARDGHEHAGAVADFLAERQRAAAGRPALPGRRAGRPVDGRPRLPAHRADHAGHDAAPARQPARGVDRRRVAGRRAAQPGQLADPAHHLRGRPQRAQGRGAGRDALPVPGAHRQGADRPAGPRLPQVQRARAVRLPAGRRPAAGVRLRVPGQRGVRRPHRRRRGADRGAAAAAGAHRGGLRAAAGHAVPPAAARRRPRRLAPAVRVRRRPRRRREDPHRPRGAAPGATSGRPWTPTRTPTGCGPPPFRSRSPRRPARSRPPSARARPQRRRRTRREPSRRARRSRAAGGRPPRGPVAHRRLATGRGRAAHRRKSWSCSTSASRAPTTSRPRPRGPPTDRDRIDAARTPRPAGARRRKPFGDLLGATCDVRVAAGRPGGGRSGARRGARPRPAPSPASRTDRCARGGAGWPRCWWSSAWSRVRR